MIIITSPFKLVLGMGLILTVGFAIGFGTGVHVERACAT